MSIYLLKIVVNKQWILFTNLIRYACKVIKLIFPSELPKYTTTQSKLFSKPLRVCKCAYRGRGPENCKNTKFVTHYC